MSREVLLACLTLALLLNLALLGQAANLYFRRRPASRVSRQRIAVPEREQIVMTLPHARAAATENESTPSNGNDRLSVIQVPVGPVAPSPVAPSPVAPSPVAPSPVAPSPVAPSPVAPVEPERIAPVAPVEPERIAERPEAADPTEPRRLPSAGTLEPTSRAEIEPEPALGTSAVEHEPADPEPLRPERPDVRPLTFDAAPNETSNGTLAEPTPAEERRGSKRGSRGRRFVLPPLDEDQARSVRAIEAFLDGPPPPSGAAATGRAPRRRHRARRAPGSPIPRTTMVVSLRGFSDLDRIVGTSRAANVSAAFVDALRRAARATDDVRELGSGRVRVVVETDDAGATAFVERARKGVQPWLELLAVPLNVESGARESSEVVPFTAGRRAAGDHQGFGRP